MLLTSLKKVIGRYVWMLPFVPKQKWLITCLRRYLKFQLPADQAAIIVRSIKAYSGCRLLVFGAGNDTGFWMKVNRKGKTVFLEDLPAWFQAAHQKYPRADIRLIEYHTKLSDWKVLLDRADKLMLHLPDDILNSNWDVIIVDGPRGYGSNSPGRMQSIATSARLAKRSSIFVHDCERQIENVYCDTYLGIANLVMKKVSKNGSELRHYFISGL